MVIDYPIEESEYDPGEGDFACECPYEVCLNYLRKPGVCEDCERKIDNNEEDHSG